MTNNLRNFFPMIRTRRDLLEEIGDSFSLSDLFDSWSEEQREDFLDFCTGSKGVKILYDSFFKEIMNPETTPERLQNKGIKSDLDAWLTFLSTDNPEWIERLIRSHPEFIPMYTDIYELCRNTEKVMELYSKELSLLDKNTVQLMIDEMQDTIDGQRGMINEQKSTINKHEGTITQLQGTVDEQKREIEKLRRQLENQTANSR